MFEFHITNGMGPVGLTVKYYGYSILKNKERIATMGYFKRSETEENEIINYYLPFGESILNYKNTEIICKIVKEGIIVNETAISEMYPYHITLLIDIEPKKGELIINDFLKESSKFYKESIRELKDDPAKLSVHIFDEYWDILNKRNKRNINTIHLDGDEKKILEYIRDFLKPETKYLYDNLGIPYKLNILLEGLPGTGKTSLIYTLASELNKNIAILNFNKDVDDNSFMRALRKIPKDSIFVLEDIDVLFKERKENDNFKSMISFSGLLNSLDGMAFKDSLITIMTTNYECNLDTALKRPGRIDKSITFGFAKKSQVNEMYNKFFPELKDNFIDFYKEIKNLNFTTAMIQQYFIWHMYNKEKLIENLEEFRELCSKHNYETKLDLYM
jgi:hypothetical protein